MATTTTVAPLDMPTSQRRQATAMSPPLIMMTTQDNITGWQDAPASSAGGFFSLFFIYFTSTYKNALMYI
jgi:hypothetical protein